MRIGRATFLKVAQSQLEARAKMIADAAEKVTKDKAAADAQAKMEAEKAEALARGETVVVSPLADPAAREAAEQAANNKPLVIEGTAEVVAETKPEANEKAPEANDKPPVANEKPETDKPNGEKPNGEKVASEAETQNAMRVHDERTRGEAEKLAEAWTPSKVQAWVLNNMITSRLNENTEFRVAAVAIFAHLAGQLGMMGAEGKAFVAKPTDPNKAKDLTRRDVAAQNKAKPAAR
jgi:hypothetical protein